MSSLWTPGGEVPVDRNRAESARSAPSTSGATDEGPAPPRGAPGAPREPAEEELAAHAEQMTRILLSTPAPDVVAQHAMGLYELAVVHLSQDEPDLEAARLAIDALACLLEGLRGRLGDAESQLQSVLPQLQMAFVEVKDRAS